MPDTIPAASDSGSVTRAHLPAHCLRGKVLSRAVVSPNWQAPDTNNVCCALWGLQKSLAGCCLSLLLHLHLLEGMLHMPF